MKEKDERNSKIQKEKVRDETEKRKRMNSSGLSTLNHSTSDDKVQIFFRCEGFVNSGSVESTVCNPKHVRISELVIKVYNGLGYLYHKLIPADGSYMVVLQANERPCKSTDYLFFYMAAIPSSELRYGQSPQFPFRIFVKTPEGELK